MSSVKTYLSLIKFSHTIFAMPFALIGFFLGVIGSVPQQDLSSPGGLPSLEGAPGWAVYARLLGLVILCMVFARSAAMAFNRYLDRKWDALNPRTAIREVPRGLIKPEHALTFTLICCLLFIVCTYFINTICFALSPVALGVVLGYSYTKRFTSFCHLVLGLGLSLAPIGAFLAVTGVFQILPLIFSSAVLFWVSGFDIIYALQDEEFDRDNQLYSIPASVGKLKALTVSELLHLASAGCIVAAGAFYPFGWLYWVGVLVFGGMLIYQHSIIRPNDLRRVNIAFMTANGVASILFAILVISDLLVHR